VPCAEAPAPSRPSESAVAASCFMSNPFNAALLAMM
jgi:hypothetical protein